MTYTTLCTDVYPLYHAPCEKMESQRSIAQLCCGSAMHLLILFSSSYIFVRRFSYAHLVNTCSWSQRTAPILSRTNSDLVTARQEINGHEGWDECQDGHDGTCPALHVRVVAAVPFSSLNQLARDARLNEPISVLAAIVWKFYHRSGSFQTLAPEQRQAVLRNPASLYRRCVERTFASATP